MNKQLKTAYENLIKEHGKVIGALAPLHSALESSLIYLPSRISELDLPRLGNGFYFSRNQTSFLLSACISSAMYTAYELTKTSRLKKIDYFGMYDDITEALRNLCPNQEFTTETDEALIKLNNDLDILKFNISQLKDMVKKDYKY